MFHHYHHAVIEPNEKRKPITINIYHLLSSEDLLEDLGDNLTMRSGVDVEVVGGGPDTRTD